MSRIAEAVERIVLIGAMPGSAHDRYRSAGFAIRSFAEQARMWHRRFGSIDIEDRVRRELGDLERAIALRLGAYEETPEHPVGLLLERLVAEFPERTR